MGEVQLALALLVARVGLADNHDHAVTTNRLALVADGLNGGLNLHDVPYALSSCSRVREPLLLGWADQR